MYTVCILNVYTSVQRYFLSNIKCILCACAKKFTKYLIMEIKKYIILKSAYFI